MDPVTQLQIIAAVVFGGGAAYGAFQRPPEDAAEGARIVLTFLGRCALGFVGVFILFLLASAVVNPAAGLGLVLIFAGIGVLIILAAVGGVAGLGVRWLVAWLDSGR